MCDTYKHDLKMIKQAFFFFFIHNFRFKGLHNEKIYSAEPRFGDLHKITEQLSLFCLQIWNSIRLQYLFGLYVICTLECSYWPKYLFISSSYLNSYFKFCHMWYWIQSLIICSFKNCQLQWKLYSVLQRGVSSVWKMLQNPQSTNQMMFSSRLALLDCVERTFL